MLTILGVIFIVMSLSIRFFKSEPINKKFLPYFKGLFLTGVSMIVLAPLHIIFQLVPIMIFAMWSLYVLDNIMFSNDGSV